MSEPQSAFDVGCIKEVLDRHPVRTTPLDDLGELRVDVQELFGKRKRTRTLYGTMFD
jgi:hypothetical protein